MEQYSSLVIPLAVFGVFFWIMTSTSRKEKQQKEAMAKSLRKGLKVRTIGGLLGTVEEVRENDVVLLVDEKNSTKLVFSKSSIGVIESEDDKKTPAK